MDSCTPATPHRGRSRDEHVLKSEGFRSFVGLKAASAVERVNFEEIKKIYKLFTYRNKYLRDAAIIAIQLCRRNLTSQLSPIDLGIFVTVL